MADALELLESLVGRWYEPSDCTRIVAGSSTGRALTLRANTLLASADDVRTELLEAGFEPETVPWYEDAFVLEGSTAADLWDLPLYREGRIYVQSLSSMIPPLVLAARTGDDVLDMCAAPGGKTSQIAALAHLSAHVTACEMHAPRAEKLEHNLNKLGAANVVVMRTDARRLDDFFSFDRILVDAPCSGSGTLRAGDAKQDKRFTRALVDKSRKSQQALLDKALRILKPGGTLVYSTCSVLKCENEDIVTQALARTRKVGSYAVTPVKLENAQDIPTLPSSIEGALTVCPTNLYEGFFAAKIVRNA